MMYRDHIRECNDVCQGSAEATTRMLRFVIATIQQQLETVPDILLDFEEFGPESRFAFGQKADGLAYIHEHGERIYFEALAAMDDDVELMHVFLQVPSLGLVKAGFACQLFAGRVGCLDVHNIRLYGLSRKDLRINKQAKLAATIERRVRAYCELCRKLGGPVSLWAAWCDYKANVAPAGNWPHMGASVSLMHVEACAGEFYDTLPAFMDYEDAPRFRLA